MPGRRFSYWGWILSTSTTCAACHGRIFCRYRTGAADRYHLIFEMTGSLSQMLSLAIVSVTAYVAATFLRSKPIYESLLDRLLKRQGQKGDSVCGRKILTEFVVEKASLLDGIEIKEADWPENCLLVTVKRGAEEII